MPGLIESEENSNAPTLTNSGGRPSSDDEEEAGIPTLPEQPEHWPPPHSSPAGYMNAVEGFYDDIQNGPDPDQEISNAFQSFRRSLRSVAGLSDVDRNTLQMSLNGLERTVERQCTRMATRIELRRERPAEAEDPSLPISGESGEDADRR